MLNYIDILSKCRYNIVKYQSFVIKRRKNTMALIFCPNCGKQVSDTVDVCIHCGAPIKEALPAPKDFSGLPKEQQLAMDAEFEGRYVGHSPMKSEKRRKRFSIICTVIFLVLGVLFISLIVTEAVLENRFYRTHGLHIEGEQDLTQISESQWAEWREQLDADKLVVENRDGETIIMTGEEEFQLHLFNLRFIFCWVVLSLVIIVYVVVTVVRHRRVVRKHLQDCKLFQIWIEAEKGITYHLHLSPKDQIKFNAMDVSKIK